MNTHSVAKKPATDLERKAWVMYQLKLRSLSIAEIARREGVSRRCPALAFDRPYPRMEVAIAKAIGVRPEQIWPERYDSQGLPKRGRPHVRRTDLQRPKGQTAKSNRPAAKRQKKGQDKASERAMA